MFKNFYKPNKQKVIIAILIMIINISTAWYSANTALCTEGCAPPNNLQTILSPSLIVITPIFFIGEFFENIRFLPESMLMILAITTSFFFLALFWYSLSCIIVKIKLKFKNI